jgi:hypothetical protein
LVFYRFYWHFLRGELLSSHFPDAPCMEYFPTFTI